MTSPTINLQSSSRIALAAMLHDLGKLTERARVFDDKIYQEQLETHRTLFCPVNFKTKRHSHIHAAYTAMSYDFLEAQTDNENTPIWPDLKSSDQSSFPFSGLKSNLENTLPLEERITADNSLVTTSAMHHKPSNFLQWIIATADRVASSFERSAFDDYNNFEEGEQPNHYTARLWSLLERVEQPAKHDTRYPLKPYSPASIQPTAKDANNKQEAQQEYKELWDGFLESLSEIPASHRHNLSLWLDHFDSLWLTYTHAIPASTYKTEPDVSLYDHSKTTAALATALWRFYAEQPAYQAQTQQQAWADELKERKNFDDNQLLLIQGDFTGIQEFLFSNGGEATKNAARLLRGRSFYVSLVCELAALKILESLELPSTSQITNAAGKFLILAPATEKTIQTIKQVEEELNQWFLDNSFGEASVVLAIKQASLNDLMTKNFGNLMASLFQQLDEAKLKSFNLLENNKTTFSSSLTSFENDMGACQISGKHPATIKYDGMNIGKLARDQIVCGKHLANPKKQRIMISKQAINTEPDDSLMLDIFGYHVAFTDQQGFWNDSGKLEDGTGKFGELSRNGVIRRFWDISLPTEKESQALWNGYARRYINAYVPVIDDTSILEGEYGKYSKLSAEEQPSKATLGNLKTLNHLACEDRSKKYHEDKWLGENAITTLQGDIDDLGKIFQQGLEQPTFAKMASLSRQINSFFAVYLPWLCKTEFKNTYTVFAGGDDFFLIGPWQQTIKLANRLKDDFANFVSNNPNIHFSAGLSMTKPGLPIHTLSENAQEALEQAKQHKDNGKAKNAVNLWQHTLSWQKLDELLEASGALDELHHEFNLSLSYRYGLINLADMAASQDPKDSIWRSRLTYRTHRYILDQVKDEAKQKSLQDLINQHLFKGLERHKSNYKVAIFNHLYQYRD